jgi:hypothetical protein
MVFLSRLCRVWDREGRGAVLGYADGDADVDAKACGVLGWRRGETVSFQEDTRESRFRVTWDVDLIGCLEGC